MAIIMGKGCLEAIYGLMGWKGLRLRMLKLNSSLLSLSMCLFAGSEYNSTFRMYQRNGQCSVVKHLGDLFFYRFRYNAVCISIIIYLSAERIHMSKMMLPSFYLILI